MNSEEIRKSFHNFFEERGHKIVPSSSLIPDDPSVLLTTAGMQQFKKYFTGELDPKKDFGSLSTASVQKCFRTSDIDEVGDESHLTFFEMLGNFSFGGYFKEKAIEYGFEFITKVMKLEIDYVSVFDPAKVPAGDWRKDVPFDEESFKIWHKFLPVSKIRRASIDNFWGPTGTEGPCGPTTEIYVKGVELWNIVFNQFYCSAEKKLVPLKIQGVDTGMGLERLAMVSQKVPTIFENDLFKSLVELLPAGMDARTKRIFVDHFRGSFFLIADGLRPSNKEREYILRRLLRRTFAHQIQNPISPELISRFYEAVKKIFVGFYPEIDNPYILEVVSAEKKKFDENMSIWVREFSKHIKVILSKKLSREVTLIEIEEEAFELYQTFGVPLDFIRELLRPYGFSIDEDKFRQWFKKHQEISRAGQEKKFGGHGLLLDTGELKAKDEAELKKVTRLHTATHLLQAALRKVLGPEVNQMGSDITVERTRFDFTFPCKLTAEEIKKVEDLVNDIIKKDLPMQYKEMPIEEAKKTGALHFFSARGGSALGGKEKYPERVKVYYAGRSLEDAFSKEFCGGPHVTHTGEIGKFKIVKEEAVGAGVRRIRATVEP